MKFHLNFWVALLYVLIIMVLGVAYFGSISWLDTYLLTKGISSSIIKYLFEFGQIFYALPIIIILIKKLKINLKSQFRIPNFLGLLITISGVSLLYGFFLFLKYILTNYSPTYDFSFFLNLSWSKTVSILILTPILEEILHRGLILNEFLKLYGTTKAIILSSILFTFSHLDWTMYIPLFSSSILISLIYFKFRKNLVLAILFHFLWNVCSQIF